MKNSKELIENLIEELERVPIITVACSNVGISRQTYYRWIREDSTLRDQLEKAQKIGVESINDLSESKLIELVKDKSFQAIRFWLGNNKGKYISPKPADVVRSLLNLEKDKVMEVITRTMTSREEVIDNAKLEAYKKKHGDIDVNIKPYEWEQKEIELELRKLARKNIIETRKRKDFAASGLDYDELHPDNKKPTDIEEKEFSDTDQEDSQENQKT
jgi:hypothetical protein